ncbi:DUF4339 domain-containing protein [Gimesia chilikensis]|nr:DUF4339 domain-containing protein [Gimesia chilikensis]
MIKVIAMAREWYYSQGGERRGPIDSATLKQLASTGKIQPETLVWRAGMQNWVKAKTIKSLFRSNPPLPDSQEVRSDDHESQGASQRQDEKHGIFETLSAMSPRRKILWLFCGSSGAFFIACCGLCGIAGLITERSSNSSISSNATSGGDYAENEPSPENKDETPSEDQMVQLIAEFAILTSGNVSNMQEANETRNRQKWIDGWSKTSPEDFQLRMRSLAKELGADKYEHSRHLLEIEPTSTKETVVEGTPARIIVYGPWSAKVTIFFIGHQGRYRLYMATVGDKRYTTLGISEG